MRYDVFFSISHTPAGGQLPTEAEMFRNFFDQVRAADDLGFEVAWVAESHLSSEVQKQNPNPVIPHWRGEVGLNVDITQLAHQVFGQTVNIEVGSAVMNILCNGGPVAAAERVAYFAALHGSDPRETRRLHVGFAAGRFDFMNRAYGIAPREPLESALGPALKGLAFAEATEIFLRLLRGDTIASDDVAPRSISRPQVRSDEHWATIQAAAGTDTPAIGVPRRWTFERLKIVPQEFRRDLLVPVIGTHDPALQEEANRWLPVQVFNLSITQPHVIENTHRRMTDVYHRDGGPWLRAYMPRTVFVFLNEEDGLTPTSRTDRARAEAQAALGAYWTALEGTIDPAKVAQSADNALIGNADDIAAQMVERFHPDDRLMLWFDFFNHDNERVIRNMERFVERVAPRVEARLEEQAERKRGDSP